ncbi:transposase [Methanococcus aeolicus]|uniref:Transposase IS4-like domain-containing protein n=1 Tax=Methanococcus aeolicus (strain ATCC BAA-1280 / DSM 17508 / OCM 812 / Nankai-3) TaxID=419665 RepID=A6UUF0_META3|nr:transposase [Methanococcus aeolicus]ABR56122.1 hypothetical protein Maeo_0536 [Methanococcus aeolicus Nankai-3]UXM85270.1 transposase [Methanococcus aeolicus]
MNKNLTVFVALRSFGKIGYNSEGMFKGFKLHLAVDKLGIPLRIEFTTGNTHDYKVADKLLVCTKKSCADAGYDKRFKKVMELYENERITAHNSRRLVGKKNKKKLPKLISKN